MALLDAVNRDLIKIPTESRANVPQHGIGTCLGHVFRPQRALKRPLFGSLSKDGIIRFNSTY